MALVRHAEDQFYCGPLLVRVTADDSALQARLAETLSVYDYVWRPPHRLVAVRVSYGSAKATMVSGTFLRCGRTCVDAQGDHLFATSLSGASATYQRIGGVDHWSISVPPEASRTGQLEIEDFVILILATGWRLEGWVPVHSATVTKDGVCALLCARSGGGKSTTTAALVRRGWQTLGDDKLLLRLVDGYPVVRALLHTLNLHPRTREWFPEVGDLDGLPTYSAWTDKRRVRAGAVWLGAAVESAAPTHVVRLERTVDHSEIRVSPLSNEETLAVLLRQIVIPTHRETARHILSVATETARRLRGISLEVGTEAFGNSGSLEALEEALR